jgi:DNA-binding MarR family transcriptional regulator
MSDATRSEPAATPERDVVAARLARVVGRVGRRTRPSHGELSAGHYSTLSSIDQLGPQRLGDLARTERVSAPTMTRLVTTLEERGLAQRTATPEDARSVTVEITAAGRALVLAARAERASAVRALLDVLDDDAVARIDAALDALEAVAREALLAAAQSSSTTR